MICKIKEFFSFFVYSVLLVSISCYTLIIILVVQNVSHENDHYTTIVQLKMCEKHAYVMYNNQIGLVEVSLYIEDETFDSIEKECQYSCNYLFLLSLSSGKCRSIIC